MAKVAVSLDDQLYQDAVEVANRDTDGNFSALVSLALRREIQRRVGLELVAEYEKQFGEISEETMDSIRRELWSKQG
jgi:hypothetical protein